MRRRDLLMSGAIAAGAAARGAAQNTKQAKLERLAIMTYSFHRIVKGIGEPGDPNRSLDFLDTPEMFADRYGIHNVEGQHAHFESTEPAYLQEFVNRLKKSKSRLTNICLEFGPLNISATDPIRRTEAVDLTKRWVDIAVVLGCPRVMVNQGSISEEVMPIAIEALRRMGDYGKSRNVHVTMENRGQPWQLVAEVTKGAGTMTNPDMGNFPNAETQKAGIRGLFVNCAGSAHVKLRPDRFDLAEAIHLSESLGYKGLYSMEAGRNIDPDPYVAVQKLIDVVLEAL